jgi:hypothetical protein
MHAVQHASHPTAPSSTERARRPGRRLAISAMLTACAVLVVLVALSVGRGAESPTNAIADPLLVAARAALRQPTLFPAGNQYFYQRTEGTSIAGVSTRSGTTLNAFETILTDSWRSAGRPGLMRQRVISVRFGSRAAAARWRADGGRVDPGTSTSSAAAVGGYPFANFGALTRREIFALPTNPKLLFKRLFAHNVPPSTRARYEFNVTAGTLLADPLPPRLRSALFGVLTLIPGVKSIGQASDLLGRRGAAVALTAGGIRTELIFDPQTSEVLGTRGVAIRGGEGIPGGRVYENLAYIDEAVTSSLTIPSIH